jgi:hypothetical protein
VAFSARILGKSLPFWKSFWIPDPEKTGGGQKCLWKSVGNMEGNYKEYMKAFYITKRFQLIFTHPWRGGVFFWRDFKFNRGRSYLSYRIGPIILRDFL